MIFVPLPLFATLCLTYLLFHMVRFRDMALVSNQAFALLVGLYGLQSGLLSVRWGYDVQALRVPIGMIAPLLPVCAYLAYRTLNGQLTVISLWPLGIVALNWAVLIALPDVADFLILATFLGFGIAILRQSYGENGMLALVRLTEQDTAHRAMVLTGAALVASAVADLFVIVDFIRTGGQNIGFTVALAQSGFLLLIGIAAMAGQSGVSEAETAAITETPEAQEEDDAIMARLSALFVDARLHRDTDLNLRRLSRRLGLPDRAVSQAINRTQDMSVSQYVNTYRIMDACDLLKETDQSILQVSLAAGFLTKSNFNREFSRVTGLTPSQWRKTQA